jgi:hypothetical protein
MDAARIAGALGRALLALAAGVACGALLVTGYIYVSQDDALVFEGLFTVSLFYGLAIAAAALLHVLRLRRGDRPGATWILAGLGVSVAAALVQRSGFALHPHFNHNDLYHVVQMLGTWLLYRGGRDLPATGA